MCIRDRAMMHRRYGCDSCLCHGCVMITHHSFVMAMMHRCYGCESWLCHGCVMIAYRRSLSWLCCINDIIVKFHHGSALSDWWWTVLYVRCAQRLYLSTLCDHKEWRSDHVANHCRYTWYTSSCTMLLWSMMRNACSCMYCHAMIGISCCTWWSRQELFVH